MIAPRFLNACLVGLIALVLSTSYLLGGPSELEAMQATAAAKQDAIKSAAMQASKSPAKGLKDHKTVLAGVQP